MDVYYEVSDSSVETFNEVYDKKTFPVNVGFQFIGNSKQKSLIKIAKLADHYVFLLKKELLVSINEDLMDVFDDESIKILIEQELDKISVNLDTGKVKVVKLDLTTSSGIINKYGIEKVAKANKVEELYNQQKKDGTVEEDKEFII
jgi:hypothetical protein